MRAPCLNRFVRQLPAILLAAFVCLASTTVLAYDDRVALVIGNDNYPGEPLRNGVNDARAVQKALQDLGFKVVFRPNADIVAMRSAAVDFAKMLDGATAALFYYAGHGIQYRDKNYLIPIDAKLTSEPEIVYNALEVGQIIESMEDAKVRYKFIILDACRNNPFRNVFSSSGLAKIARVPPGTIISYAAAAGAIAQDGDGENGLFTKHLLREISNPNNQAVLVFQNIGVAVGQESGGRQIPEYHSVSLPGGRPFFFAEGGAKPAVAVSGAVSGETNALLDRDFWNGVKDSRKVEDFQIYLEQFPTGTFARLARSRIDNLKQEKTQSQVAASPPSSPANGTVKPAPVQVAEKAADAPVQPPVSSTPALTVAAAAPSANAAPVKTVTTEMAVTQQENAPMKVAMAPTNGDRGIEGKSATGSPPVTVTSSASQASPAVPPQTAAAKAPSTAPASAAVPPPGVVSAAPSAGAPGANQIAAISPEQKTALPAPPPQFPKFLSGTLGFSDGARYVGEYKEDKEKNQILHGKGEYVASNFRYVGEFRDGKKEGRGLYVWADGDKYEGDFADDAPSGKGKWEFAKGGVYEGEVVKGVMSGKGLLVTKNGDRFEGQFRDSAPNGKGVYLFASGDKYEGMMSASKMSGPGVYTTKSGDRIEATFTDGVPQGKGIYYFSNGDRYEGDFKGSELTGKGKYFFANGQRTEGNYVNGTLKGEGAFYFGDGSWFEGQFEDGIKRAKGTYYYKDGTRRAADMTDGLVTPVSGG